MTCPYIVGGTTKHCTLAERALPPHEHIRDQLAAVIADIREPGTGVVTIADRCVHVLVLLGVLPEVNE